MGRVTRVALRVTVLTSPVDGLLLVVGPVRLVNGNVREAARDTVAGLTITIESLRCCLVCRTMEYLLICVGGLPVTEVPPRLEEEAEEEREETGGGEFLKGGLQLAQTMFDTSAFL